MRYLILLVAIITLGFTSYAYAIPDDGNAGSNGSLPFGSGTGPSGGECNWDAVKTSILETETLPIRGQPADDRGLACRQRPDIYTTLGLQHPRYGYATGAYQFMETTIEQYIRQAPHCNGGGCRGQAAFRSEACWPVQECFMDAMLSDSLERVRNDPACQRLLACERRVGGYGSGGCKGRDTNMECCATESGLLAAFHLGGADECRKMLANGHGDDDGHTQTGYYTCYHGGLPVPGDCTPQDYGVTSTGGSPPTGTATQIDFAVNSGDIPNTGFSILGSWVVSLAQMTEQITTTMIQQAQIIGTFFDAKHQLETQRILQHKYAEAHKDYHPSEQMCEIGTFVRNLANTEERAVLTHTAMARSMLDRALGTGDSQTSYIGTDEDTRLKSYIEKFCDISDNSRQNNLLCRTSGSAEQQNADINFTQTIDVPLTLDLNLLDGTAEPDEESLFAFLDYIFMHDSFPWISKGKVETTRFKEPYQSMRSLVAMRSVAQDSFAYIISEKTQSPDGDENVGPYMQSLLQEMGVSDADIRERIGNNPSYYAQMEMLTKIIYQDPNFMANLYDKPANVKRIRAAMTAIKLMQDRDIHKALMRREMLVSMLLEMNLRKEQKELSKSVDLVNSNPAGVINENGQIIQMGP